LKAEKDNAITRFFKPQAQKVKMDENVSTLKDKKKSMAVPDEGQIY
jgi:flagellar biosynthesis protein FlhA